MMMEEKTKMKKQKRMMERKKKWNTTNRVAGR